MDTTAGAVLASPPSMVGEIMAELEIDPAVLDGLRLPQTASAPPPASQVVELARKEQAQTLAAAAPDSPEAQLTAAQERLTAAQQDVEDTKKGIGRAYYQVTKARKADDNEAEQLARTQHQDAKDAHKQALATLADAESDVRLAEYGCRDSLDAVARDEYLASLTSEDQQAIADAATRRYAQQARQDLIDGNPLAVSDTAFDTSIYETGTLHAVIDDQTVDVEGRRMDAGTAIHRKGYGDFAVLYDVRGDGTYEQIAAVGSKQQAIEYASRIPHITGREHTGNPDSPLHKEVAEANASAIRGIAADAAHGKLSREQAQQQLTSRLETASTDAADALGGARVRADIADATHRHKGRVRHAAAHEAGEKARAAALDSGASSTEADAAYKSARRRALGTPTIGGGVIPIFDHKIPPESLGDAAYQSLYRSGIRAHGTETASDYQVIATRAGTKAPSQWGFNSSSAAGDLQTSSIGTLTKTFTPVVSKLDPHETSALTKYTGGSYRAINAAVTGRDATPSPSTKATVESLASAFEKVAAHNTNTTAMTVVRGTTVPSGWKGSRSDYMDKAFTVGSRMQIGKVTSATTKTTVAQSFGGGGSNKYIMAIRTRDGLPVRNISQHKGEDEVIVPPGADLRCVHIDNNGIGGMPTVYLVAEDLVAEADEGISS
ncbi:MAG: ADP-ribosyltransferase domain-containing protein [Tomitella sp.]|nr:ADP-ribosyltransferase domain-containing protein [Tomitella sp.]